MNIVDLRHFGWINNRADRSIVFVVYIFLAKDSRGNRISG